MSLQHGQEPFAIRRIAGFDHQVEDQAAFAPSPVCRCRGRRRSRCRIRCRKTRKASISGSRYVPEVANWLRRKMRGWLRLQGTLFPEKSTMSGPNPIELAAGVVAAFVSNNSVPVGELPALIQAVHTSIKRLAEGPEITAPQVESKAPAVSIRKSVTPFRCWSTKSPRIVSRPRMRRKAGSRAPPGVRHETTFLARRALPLRGDARDADAYRPRDDLQAGVAAGRSLRPCSASSSST